MAPVDGNDEVLYGVHAVREALRSGVRPLQRLMVARTDGRFAELVALGRAMRIPIHVEPQAALDRMVRQGRHQGVVGIVSAGRYAERDEILSFAASQAQPPFVVVLDGVEDPHNLGAVIRTSEAAGAHGIFLPERRSVGLTGAVAKASSGALAHMRISRATNLSRLIESLQRNGLWVYGFDAGSPKCYTAVDYRGPIALVLGGEEKGIRPGVLEKCDETVRVPMRGKVASLNVSAAAAIALFEVVRQRTVANG
ncbi:MAG TPA: 23S rRNA (guanosine(2251)-2'-O)-methyltransferase RlmB [Nitrospiraceae bacterium]|nr:23S rRNA (guanosine(2251)-2'-O)-methyltransferase RlmB [Nitrospiraceae bacterium]